MKNNNDDMWNVGNAQIYNDDDGSSISQNGKGFFISAENFGPLAEYVKDEDITDIDYNGSDLWITDIRNKHWKDTSNKITPKFIRKLSQDIANSASKEFNQKNPCLEAETEDLRISILHNSIAQTGITMCIRKTPRANRISERYALESTLADFRIQSLIANCVKAHMNFVICGEPRAGKTEFAKFISSFIPPNERVITIEDVMEWRFKALHPEADVIEMKVNKDFDYSDGIVASLKQNPRWLMIAETRGKEVKNLIQSFSTGVNGITTLHTDDIRKIPSRIVNMADDSMTSTRMENSTYEFVDVGIYISMYPDGDGGFVRRVDQLGFFSSDDGENKCRVIIEGGELFKSVIPDSIKWKLEKAGVSDIFYNQEVYDKLRQQGYNVSNIVIDKSVSDRYMRKKSIQDIAEDNDEKARRLKERAENKGLTSFDFSEESESSSFYGSDVDVDSDAVFPPFSENSDEDKRTHDAESVNTVSEADSFSESKESYEFSENDDEILNDESFNSTSNLNVDDFFSESNNSDDDDDWLSS